MSLGFGCALAVGLAAFEVGGALAAGVVPGDLVVVDHQSGAVIRVDPVSGAQTVLLSGPSFTDVATEANGRFAASFAGLTTAGVGEIDPTAATFIPSSPTTPWASPLGVGAGKSGHILAADQFSLSPCGNGGTIFDVDPVAGTGTCVLFLHAHPLDVVLESSDSVVIASEVLGLVRFHLGQFNGRVLAGKDAAFFPRHIALAANGEIFAVSIRSGSPTPTDIYRIDPVTGAKSVVSSGGQFVNLQGIVVAPNGDLFVTDGDALPDGAGAKGAVFRVNPATGVQTPVSAGGAFRSPSGVAVAGAGIVSVPPFPGAASFGLGCLPNPATDQADIRFVLPAAARVRLEVFDLTGRKVATLIENAVMGAGPHHVVFAAGALKTDVYFACLKADSRTVARALMVIH